MDNYNNIVSYIKKRTKISIDEALCYNENVEWNGDKVYAIAVSYTHLTLPTSDLV